jgi:1-acyl-sn-glycerol-3-phosphate acyltransferase
MILLGARLPVVFVAKSEVRDWPVFGRIARQAGTLFVDRTVRRDALRASQAVEDVLAKGRSLVLFPEGTSTDGATVLPFHGSLLAGAAAARRPVHAAAIGYRTPPRSPPARTHVCWWGDMTFWDHLARLFTVPSVTAWIRIVPTAVVDGDRKALARRLHAAVARAFRPVTADPGYALRTEGPVRSFRRSEDEATLSSARRRAARADLAEERR